MFGSVDTYITFNYGSAKCVSKVIKDNKNPVFFYELLIHYN